VLLACGRETPNRAWARLRSSSEARADKVCGESAAFTRTRKRWSLVRRSFHAAHEVGPEQSDQRNRDVDGGVSLFVRDGERDRLVVGAVSVEL
jgi:hypothetical protein